MSNPNDPVLKLASLLDRGSASGVNIEQKAPGDILIEQGASNDKIFLIDEGEVEIRINGKLISSFPAPAIVGEMSMFFGKSVASVHARTKIFYRKINHDVLLDAEVRLLRDLAEFRNRTNLEQGRYSAR